MELENEVIIDVFVFFLRCEFDLVGEFELVLFGGLLIFVVLIWFFCSNVYVGFCVRLLGGVID